MLLQKATFADYAALVSFYQSICENMDANGLRQWVWGKYPSEELVASDIERGILYCASDDQGIAAAVSIETEYVEEYASVGWLFGVKPGVFRRIAVRDDLRGNGLGTKILADVEEIMISLGCDSLRCDAYQDNTTAMRMYAKRGFRQAGRVRLASRPQLFICYEKPLADHCPLLPIAMHPAFRGGALTPWGGNKLLTVYDKPIRDVPTGESLEVSCIPKLGSTDDTGMRLDELISRLGEKLVGNYADQPFPLLLKLIDAKQSLSVQVHPDNTYAEEHENGKLGKTEAWLILDAKPGSQLVYGVQEGTSLEALKIACETGGTAVEPLLRKVDVHPGDVCYIPAGCVHAIGGGITLYEIQQSSDITYRFYDWGRVDANGKARELHLEKALAVTDLDCQPSVIPATNAPFTRVLDEKYFTLDLLRSTEGHDVPLAPVHEFGMITALDSGLTLHWQGGQRSLQKGETLFLPCTAPAMVLSGEGRAAVSMPS